jgi:hypothetical protein
MILKKSKISSLSASFHKVNSRLLISSIDGIEDRTELHRSELGQFQFTACYLLDNHERAYINYEEAVHKLLKLGCRRVKKSVLFFGSVAYTKN